MDNKKHEIYITEDGSKLKIPQDRKFQFKADGKTYQVNLIENDQNQQSDLIHKSIWPIIVGSLVFLLLALSTQKRYLPISGVYSLSSFVIVIGAVSSLVLLMNYFIRGKFKEIPRLKDLSWRSFPTIIIAFTCITIFFLIAFFWLLSVAFKGAEFDIYTSTILASMFLAINNYSVNFMINNVSPSMITNLLIVVIISGVIFSIIMNQNSRWWEVNLSFLGSKAAKNAWQFNFTLILSALLMVALIDYLFVSLEKKFHNNWRLNLLRITLTMTAICLGGVGLFPNVHGDILHELHDDSALLMVCLIFFQIVAIKWLLPQVTKTFLATSYIIGGLILFVGILWKIFRYFSLTAFEIFAFILAFSWLLLLVQNLEFLSRKEVPLYVLKKN
ncbi:DUF998 domain-containing protein [Xylocopilactobacillus apis]|uniref:Transcriptional regulator n=1 Tax=Xylocopilactobacillus apis TaxID=2932183 RepID=A0AAU9D3S0_9LACO|nr:DUF998 domain-containing protein [Xylocopilactobacillus apis]BDR56065.1 transcriptional regulator [Xylocopilactobacillus apis]